MSAAARAAARTFEHWVDSSEPQSVSRHALAHSLETWFFEEFLDDATLIGFHEREPTDAEMNALDKVCELFTYMAGEYFDGRNINYTWRARWE